MRPAYTPPELVLEKYARLLVEFGIQDKHGKKPKKGSVVKFSAPEIARPLYFHLHKAILTAGYQPLGFYTPSDDSTYNFSENFYNHAKKHQLDFYPALYYRGLIDQIDCTISILAETNPEALKHVNPKKILQHSSALQQLKQWQFNKIDAGKLNWTLALYGTEPMAKEAGMSLRSYWNQIIKACYLDASDPVKEWKRINKTVQATADALTSMKIENVHVVGQDMDLTIGIGSDRVWRAGGGNNVPSYEVFTSPNYRKVNGWARFDQPHYRYGKKIEDIELWFKNGKVVKSKASKNHDLLKSMLRTPGGDSLGEFSLTDGRLSRITKFMADTLYDENRGGRYGNTHVALGSAYRDCYKPSTKGRTAKQWDSLGFNNSVVHSDIVSTTPRTVTAHLAHNNKKVIYQDGKFTL